MRRFVTHGYVAVHADYPPDFHAEIHDKLSGLVAGGEGQHGNNLLPYVPQVQQVWQHPNVRGALESILGQGYIMHPHRYLHLREEGNANLDWHKDTFIGGWRDVRNPRPWWLIAMYYPHDVVPDDGPTAVLSGRQFLTERQDGDDSDFTQVYGRAGTCFLMHFDLWHAATIKSTPGTRMVLKFDFGRTARPTAPTAPAWACADADWHRPHDDLPPCTHQLIWRDQWNWLAGQSNGRASPRETERPADKTLAAVQSDDPRSRAGAADELGLCGPAAAEWLPALVTLLHDQHEAVSINAAYALAAIGGDALDTLVDALASDDESASRHATFALGTMDRQAAGSLIDAVNGNSEQLRSYARSHAAFALGNLRCSDERLIAALAGAVKDTDPTVRICAIESLGQHGTAAKATVPHLIDALNDDQVASGAALALCRIGPAAQEAVPALARCLYDREDRYVRGFAVEALHRIGTDQAMDVLIPYLKSTRFCPLSLDPVLPY